MAEKVGIETVSLSNIERGKFYPTAENLNKIITVLEIKPDELFNFQHLATKEDLINEMNAEFTKDEKLTRLVYKFFKLVKE